MEAVKLFISVLIFISLMACQNSDDNLNGDFIMNIPTHSYLKEYWEESTQVQAFEYDESMKLILVKLFGEQETSSIRFIYDEDQRLDSAIIRQRYFPRDLHFIYNDSLISEFEVWNSNRLRQKVIFNHDEEGRIISMTRYSLNHGLLLNVLFKWEGGNMYPYGVGRIGRLLKW